METTKFHKIADELLQGLLDKIENSGEDVEVDYLNGIMSITLPDGKQYVLNKHEPSKQIWLSSPFSGAHKFSCNDASGAWIGHNNEDLMELLTNELVCLAGLEPATFSSGN